MFMAQRGRLRNTCEHLDLPTSEHVGGKGRRINPLRAQPHRPWRVEKLLWDARRALKLHREIGGARASGGWL